MGKKRRTCLPHILYEIICVFALLNFADVSLSGQDGLLDDNVYVESALNFWCGLLPVAYL